MIIISCSFHLLLDINECIGVHSNHPWITASFFEQVIQQKTYRHKSAVFIYMFSVRILAIIERLKYGLNITILEYGRKKVLSSICEYQT